MPGPNVGNELGGIAALVRAQSEVHILEPQRMEGFVKAAEFFKDVPADHQKRAGSLLDGTRGVEIAIQVAVTPVDGISGPQAVHAKSFKGQCCRRGEPANCESALRTTAIVRQEAGRQAVLVAGLDQRLQS